MLGEANSAVTDCLCFFFIFQTSTDVPGENAVISESDDEYKQFLTNRKGKGRKTRKLMSDSELDDGEIVSDSAETDGEGGTSVTKGSE
jgi:hypothetical protein